MHSQILSINEKLRLTLANLETYFSIKLDQKEIERVFDDAENDQVSYKAYGFYSQTGLPFPDWNISGVVDAYEPEILLLTSSGGYDKTRRFKAFFEAAAR